jgi:hypothetical protein
MQKKLTRLALHDGRAGALSVEAENTHIGLAVAEEFVDSLDGLLLSLLMLRWHGTGRRYRRRRCRLLQRQTFLIEIDNVLT